ncbi:MAG: hypothetical protein LBC20_09020 [Planctomycetaceae bacterium]|jgi:GTPase SAR1 family protein|nr:hypothetical protein [Planctomycetaceae bacterium]
MATTSQTTPQVAIVGTEGSGKTVLATVWAKRMTQRNDEIFLDPKGFNTGMYVEKIWTTLNRGEWNESTPPGTKFELEWDLQFGNNTYPVKLIDVAGQDLRNLFAFERHKDWDGLFEMEQIILNYLLNSSLVIFVVNLQDFVGEPDVMKRKENEFMLKEVIDTFTANENQQDIIIVFTAYDLYEAEIKKHGNFEQYIKEELIYLFHAVQNWSKKFYRNDNVSHLFFPAAAVAETEIITDTNGTVRRVPKPNFTSFGIDKLSDWIINIIKKNAEPNILTKIKRIIRGNKKNVEQEKERQKREEKTHKVTQFSRTMINLIQKIGDMVIGGIVYGIFGGFIGGIIGGIAGLAVGMIVGMVINNVIASLPFGGYVGLMGGWFVGLIAGSIIGVISGWNAMRTEKNVKINEIIGMAIGTIVGMISFGVSAWYNNAGFWNVIFAGIGGGICCGFIGLVILVSKKQATVS